MNDFYILLFETASFTCSVALLSQINGNNQIYIAEHIGKTEHTENILPLADSLLQKVGITKQDLSAVGFGRGPGGFTGLRVACSVAQGIATALNIPVISIDTMRAVAMQSADSAMPAIHVVLQDARMNEVYAAVYKTTGTDWLAIQEPILLASNDVLLWVEQQLPVWDTQTAGNWFVYGNALQEFPGLANELTNLGSIVSLDIEENSPNSDTNNHGLIKACAAIAADCFIQGELIPATQAIPLYVRDKVAFTSAERSQGLGGNPKALGITAMALHKIKPSDVPEIVSIERQVQEFPWTMANFVSGIASGYYGWVARSMGAMAGFALLMDAPDMAHLMVIGVHPHEQRQGTGSLLLQQCITHCKQSKIPALTLEVRASNQQAINFYKKHGFVQQGVRKDYYPAQHGRENGLIMTLDIS